MPNHKSPMRRDGIATPKNQKARANGLELNIINSRNYSTSPSMAKEIAPVNNWKERLKSHIARMNKRYANVRVNNRQMIMRFLKAEETENGRASYDFISVNDCRNLYANTQIKTGEKGRGEKKEDVYANHFDAWLKHPESRVYRDGVVFKPVPVGSKPLPSSYFNTWNGFTVEPKQGDWQLIKQHIDSVVCSGNASVIDYVYSWIAYKLQNPHKQAGAALVLRGKKGCGKGTLGHFLLGIYGAHGMHISNTEHLTGKFNAHLADCCLLFSDEAYFSGDKRGESTLKALVTEPTMTIERKGFDPVQQTNYLQILMATNYDWAVPASADERRYCVLDVSSARIGDRAYFAALHQQIASDQAKAAFLYDMLQRDLSQWHSGNIPETKGLQDQRLLSLDTMGRWLADSIAYGKFDGCTHSEAGYDWDGWPAKGLMTARQLRDSYGAWCVRNSVSSFCRISDTKLFKDLVMIYPKTRTNSSRGYFVGTQDEAIDLFNNFYKTDLTPI